MSCWCGSGGFRIHGHNWVCLVHRPWPGTCHLKCLQCAKKWLVRRRYTERLPRHVERSRTGLTDDDILNRINAVGLDVDLNTGQVFAVKPDGRCVLLKQIRRDPPRDSGNGTRGAYHFVKICHEGKQKKIAVHRLVWMFATGQVIPEGFDVDHIEGKQIEHPNAIRNLRLLESHRNRGRGFVSGGRSLFSETPF